MVKLKKKKSRINSDTGGLTKQQKFVGKWYFRLGFVRTLKITATLRLLVGWPKFLSGKKLYFRENVSKVYNKVRMLRPLSLVGRACSMRV